MTLKKWNKFLLFSFFNPIPGGPLSWTCLTHYKNIQWNHLSGWISKTMGDWTTNCHSKSVSTRMWRPAQESWYLSWPWYWDTRAPLQHQNLFLDHLLKEFSLAAFTSWLGSMEPYSDQQSQDQSQILLPSCTMKTTVQLSSLMRPPKLVHSTWKETSRKLIPRTNYEHTGHGIISDKNTLQQDLDILNNFRKRSKKNTMKVWTTLPT